MSTNRSTHTASLCAEFYGPVVEALQEAGIEPMGQYRPPNSRQNYHSGWRGRWRSFRTGYENHGLVYYCEVGIATGGISAVGLGIQHPDFIAISELLYARLRLGFHGISLTTNQAIQGNGESAHIQLARPGTVWDSPYRIEQTRAWMSRTLIAFRDSAQPIMAQLQLEAISSKQ